MGKRCMRALGWVIVVAAMIWGIYGFQPPHPKPVASGSSIPPFSHVFVIMMENRGPGLIGSPDAPYLTGLSRTWGYASNYFGVTHPSLPNYVALISGKTGGTHSDDPTQRFAMPTLVSQFERHHITFQAVMESLPHPGYQGNWYPPAPKKTLPITMPLHALYAKKHDPFLLVKDGILAKNHVVPLTTLQNELQSGKVPQFVWISPNLCNDMHGQPNQAGATCPENGVQTLVRRGDRFARTWVTRIMHSSAWSGNAAIFIVWDESDLTAPVYIPSHLRRYLAAGPAAPALVPALPALGALGGGKIPLIVIAREGPHPIRVNTWSDHYSLLRTLEESWHLPYLGHAAQVSDLNAFFPQK